MALYLILWISQYFYKTVITSYTVSILNYETVIIKKSYLMCPHRSHKIVSQVIITIHRMPAPSSGPLFAMRTKFSII